MANDAPPSAAQNFGYMPGVARDRDPRPDPSNAAYYGPDSMKGDRDPSFHDVPPCEPLPSGHTPFANLTNGQRQSRAARK